MAQDDPPRTGDEASVTPIEPLTPELASQVHLTLMSRFSRQTLADYLQKNPGMALVTDEGRQYVITGRWRRRSDIAELIEATRGERRLALIDGISQALKEHGMRLLVLDYGLDALDPAFYRDAGFELVERIVEYERPSAHIAKRPGSALEIRRYRPGDRDEVLEVERESFPWLWWNSQEEWDAYIANLGVEILLGVDQGQIVAYSGYTVYHRDGHLDRLAVRHSLEGRGWGTALLIESLANMERRGARRVALTTQETNSRSQALYERHGFVRARWIYEIYGRWLGQPEGSTP